MRVADSGESISSNSSSNRSWVDSRKKLQTDNRKKKDQGLMPPPGPTTTHAFHLPFVYRNTLNREVV